MLPDHLPPPVVLAPVCPPKSAVCVGLQEITAAIGEIGTRLEVSGNQKALAQASQLLSDAFAADEVGCVVCGWQQLAWPSTHARDREVLRRCAGLQAEVEPFQQQVLKAQQQAVSLSQLVTAVLRS